MQTSYILTEFPSPSETFASNDIAALKRLGVGVDVYSMRSAHPNANQMLKDRGVDDVVVFHGGVKESLYGMLRMLCSPVLSIVALAWVIRSDYARPKHLLKMLLLMPVAFSIFSKIRKRKPDVVHLFWGHYPAIVGFLVKRKLPCVKLSTFLGAYDLEYHLGVSRDVIRVSDAVFTHSRVNTPYFESVLPKAKSVNVVHRGVSIDYLSRFRGDENKQPGSWLVAGRLIKEKGIDRVIDVFSVAAKENSQAKLYIAGDGPDLPRLKSLVASRSLENQVEFKGFVSQAELFSLMDRVETFFLLSTKKGERLPNVVKEAMYFGCLCVVSRTPGIDELIDNGRNGVIVESLEPSAIVEEVSSISPARRDEMGERARQSIINHFSVTHSVEQYIEAWKYA